MQDYNELKLLITGLRFFIRELQSLYDGRAFIRPNGDSSLPDIASTGSFTEKDREHLLTLLKALTARLQGDYQPLLDKISHITTNDELEEVITILQSDPNLAAHRELNLTIQTLNIYLNLAKIGFELDRFSDGVHAPMAEGIFHMTRIEKMMKHQLDSVDYSAQENEFTVKMLQALLNTFEKNKRAANLPNPNLGIHFVTPIETITQILNFLNPDSTPQPNDPQPENGAAAAPSGLRLEEDSFEGLGNPREPSSFARTNSFDFMRGSGLFQAENKKPEDGAPAAKKSDTEKDEKPKSGL